MQSGGRFTPAQVPDALDVERIWILSGGKPPFLTCKFLNLICFLEAGTIDVMYLELSPNVCPLTGLPSHASLNLAASACNSRHDEEEEDKDSAVRLRNERDTKISVRGWGGYRAQHQWRP